MPTTPRMRIAEASAPRRIGCATTLRLLDTERGIQLRFSRVSASVHSEACILSEFGVTLNAEPPPTVETIGGGSCCSAPERLRPGHAAVRVAPAAGGVSPGAGFAAAADRVGPTTLLALSQAASASASFMNR